MRDWIKPELIIEEFELSQHVASGCTIKLGDSNSRYEKTFTFVWAKGSDSSNIKTNEKTITTRYDEDNDGYIDGTEYKQFVRDNSTSGSAPHHNWTNLIEVGDYGVSESPFNS